MGFTGPSCRGDWPRLEAAALCRFGLVRRRHGPRTTRQCICMRCTFESARPLWLAYGLARNLGRAPRSHAGVEPGAIACLDHLQSTWGTTGTTLNVLRITADAIGFEF